MKKNHKNQLYKKNIESGLQMPDFYLFTFVFYLLLESYRLNRGYP